MTKEKLNYLLIANMRGLEANRVDPSLLSTIRIQGLGILAQGINSMIIRIFTYP